MRFKLTERDCFIAFATICVVLMVTYVGFATSADVEEGNHLKYDQIVKADNWFAEDNPDQFFLQTGGVIRSKSRPSNDGNIIGKIIEPVVVGIDEIQYAGWTLDSSEEDYWDWYELDPDGPTIRDLLNSGVLEESVTGRYLVSNTEGALRIPATHSGEKRSRSLGNPYPSLIENTVAYNAAVSK